ncbi:hypothetical protein LTR85_004041 [Meristemomyces frigidus]|nr:hypothetical protein LTR85_004041 [Meristemomyces frigidus]
MATTASASMNPEGRDRKRLKSNRAGDMVSIAPANLPVMATASATAGESSSMGAVHTHDGSCHHETALKTLHTDIDAMRSLVTCQICHRFMYEPYALSCGHTYCYSCLSQWLGSNRKKTCPDCRTVIRQQPTPSYVIRELVLIFVGRTQLLPDGETSEEHHTMARDEAETVANDKANTDQRNGGLFKGCFKRDSHPLLPLHDPGDRVDRCPSCHWEVEDGYCNNCGVPVGDGFSELDSDASSEEELDHDLESHNGEDGHGLDGQEHDFEADYDDFGFGDSEDGDEIDPEAFDAAFGAMPAHVRLTAGRRFGRHVTIAHASSESEDESEDDDTHDPSMEGFIDYDEPPSEDVTRMATYDSDDTEVQEVASRTRRPRAHVVISDDEDEDQPTQAGAISVESSEDDGPIAASSQRNKRRHVLGRQRPIAVSSDEESSDEESEGNDEPESVAGGFSPLQQGGEFEGSGASERYDESEVPSSVNGTTGPTQWSDGESESEDDEDSENGWGSHNSAARRMHQRLTSEPDARAEMPRSHQAMNNAIHSQPRHRLQTNIQRRNRHANAPVSVASSQSPSVSNATRASRDSTPLFHYPSEPSDQGLPATRATSGRSSASRLPTPLFQYPHGPYRHASPSARAAPGRPMRPNHPFQLSNTLANINNNLTRQQHARPAVRSTSAASSQSSAGGGVDVRSSASTSSTGSSQTITNEPAGQRKRTFSRSVDHERLAQVYDAHVEYDDDEDEEEEY